MAPEGRTTAAYFIQLKHLVEVESNPGEVTEDEDDHNQKEDGGVVPVSGAALAVVDGGEHPDVEEEEEGERSNAEQDQSCPVLVNNHVEFLHSQLGNANFS